ncbi:hypothetical protein RHGRI_011991 [Rhododendron griersonianum]|uniref:RING-type domain-containing protein n=1 Tax=Rhododendron griersonianum TaxID=479676 RepID=A0AAV6KNV6_9ERIC|nr:hypothetical protein RHGRI_011991 [Rhododendron griersonianum]
MGQQQSREELLYQQVSYGNVEGIKALRAQGAGLEWIDREGKTPLILASMNSELYNVAKALIELGANVNAYRPGRNAGTPLHHAAKRGLEQTVKLLLSHGANTLLMNDDCQTPLDVARAKGCTNVVRAIESHICLFSGWLRELYGPGFLEVLAPQLLSRRVWVAVLPCGSRNLAKPFKLELAIYSTLQVIFFDSQPRTLIALWKANMEEPKFNQSDPTVIISDIPNKTRIKFAPANETDKQQLQRFCNACKGIPQVTHSNFPFNAQAPVVPATAPSSAEDIELAMALNASTQSAMESRPPYVDANPKSGASTSSSSQSGSGWATSPAPPRKGTTSGSEIQEVGPSSNPIQLIQNQNETSSSSLPSAPPIEDAVIDDGPVQYPSVDFSPIELSSPVVENLIPAKADEGKEDGGGASSSCVICLDAPVEGACIPCGHMAGCMSCLNEIKGKKWGCPVCRTKIDQIVRLYAV